MAHERYDFAGFDFDAGLSRQQKRAAEEKHAAETRYGEAELQAAREQAFTQGEQAGRDAALVSLEHDMARALERLGGQMQQAIAAVDDWQGQHQRLLIALLSQLVAQAFPAMAEAGGAAEIRRTLEQVLPEVREEPRLLIQVPLPLVDEMQARLGDLAQRLGMDTALTVVDDASLGGSDCRVLWQGGGCERELQGFVNACGDILARYSNGAKPVLPPVATPAAGLDQPKAPACPGDDDAEEEGGAQELDLASLAPHLSD